QPLCSRGEEKKPGGGSVYVDRAVEERHPFSARPADPKAQPFDMWSFHGSSYEWGKDDVIKLTRNFSQPNLMGAAVKGGYGGGVPVVAFWTGAVGEAVGHVETLPLTLALPGKGAPAGGTAALPVRTNAA